MRWLLAFIPLCSSVAALAQPTPCVQGANCRLRTTTSTQQVNTPQICKLDGTGCVSTPLTSTGMNPATFGAAGYNGVTCDAGFCVGTAFEGTASVNVLDPRFGAKCDGVHDDTAAINAASIAVASLPNGGTVNINLPYQGHPCKVTGQGLRAAGPNQLWRSAQSAVPMIDCTGLSAGFACVDAGGYGFRLEDMGIAGTNFKNVGVYGNGGGELDLRNVLIQNFTWGVFLNSSGLLLEDSIIQNNAVGVSLNQTTSDSTIFGNTFIYGATCDGGTSNYGTNDCADLQIYGAQNIRMIGGVVGATTAAQEPSSQPWAIAIGSSKNVTFVGTEIIAHADGGAVVLGANGNTPSKNVFDGVWIHDAYGVTGSLFYVDAGSDVSLANSTLECNTCAQAVWIDVPGNVLRQSNNNIKGVNYAAAVGANTVKVGTPNWVWDAGLNPQQTNLFEIGDYPTQIWGAGNFRQIDAGTVNAAAANVNGNAALTATMTTGFVRGYCATCTNNHAILGPFAFTTVTPTQKVRRVSCAAAGNGSGGTTGLVIQLRDIQAGSSVSTCNIGTCSGFSSGDVYQRCDLNTAALNTFSSHEYSLWIDSSSDCASYPSTMSCEAEVTP